MLEVAIHEPGAQRMGFFTDVTTCIGCKACEVACKQWNDLPADRSTLRKNASYDNTGSLSASTWRHVRFVEVRNLRGLGQTDHHAIEPLAPEGDPHYRADFQRAVAGQVVERPRQATGRGQGFDSGDHADAPP